MTDECPKHGCDMMIDVQTDGETSKEYPFCPLCEISALKAQSITARLAALGGEEGIAQIIHEHYFDGPWSAETGAARACMLQAARALIAALTGDRG